MSSHQRFIDSGAIYYRDYVVAGRYLGGPPIPLIRRYFNKDDREVGYQNLVLDVPPFILTTPRAWGQDSLNELSDKVYL